MKNIKRLKEKGIYTTTDGQTEGACLLCALPKLNWIPEESVALLEFEVRELSK